MINWIMVASVTIGAALGTEIGRRRAVICDQPVSLMPVFHERALSFMGCFGATLSYETARVALKAPTSDHVLHLILAGLFTAVVLSFHLTRELSLTRKELERQQSK